MPQMGGLKLVKSCITVVQLFKVFWSTMEAATRRIMEWPPYNRADRVLADVGR